MDDPLALDGTGSYGPLPITAFHWTEGGVDLGTSAAVTLFPTYGAHTYQLTVTDSGGRAASKQITVNIDLDHENIDRLPIGMNVEFNEYFTCDPSFIDSFYHGTNWSNTFDSAGWHPASSGGTTFDSLMFYGCGLDVSGKRYLAGNYTVRYRDYRSSQSGPYELDSVWDGRQTPISVTKQQDTNTGDSYWQGRISVDVPGAGIWLSKSAAATNPTDAGFRNLQVINPGGSCRNLQTKRIRLGSMCDPDGEFLVSNPGLDPQLRIEKCKPYEECAPFSDTVFTAGVDSVDTLFQRTRQLLHPFYVQRLSHSSTLRFMDMEKINGSTETDWAARPTLLAAPATDRPTPWEIVILLANASRTDLWLNIPAQATDDYVRQLATLVKTYLDPDLKVYVEYSNEVWNLFPQYYYAEAQGNALPGGGGVDAWIPYRSMQVWAPFDEAIGRARVVHVQAHQLWADRFIASLLYHNSYEQTDVLAIAPYFGALPQPAGNPTVWTVDDVVNALDANVNDALAAAQPWMNKLLAFKGMRHIRLVAYEGGEGVTTGGYTGADGIAATAVVTAAQSDPRLQAIHKRYFDGWRALGGTTFNFFTNRSAPSKWGFWGLRDFELTMSHPQPKEAAFWQYGNDNPIWWSAEGRSGPPAPYELARIGITDSNFQGDSVFFNDKIYLSGGGGFLGNDGADHFNFLSQPVSGDIAFTAHITEATHTGFTADGGVMFRDGIGLSDPYFAITCGSGYCAARGRSSAGAAAGDIGSSVSLSTTDFWARIVRHGNAFTASVSSDGTTWTELGAATIVMASSGRVGPFENKGHWLNATPGADQFAFNLLALSSWQLQ